ncbi:hypothetical protein AB6B32_18435 [Acinetobacter baumannii]
MKVIQLEEGRIYHLDDGTFVIADKGGYLEGSYATRESAELALKNASIDEYRFLGHLRDEINIKQNRSITVEDLKIALGERDETIPN